ncbi:non-ribosomal peptide synthetase [Methylocapsa aurea]|uniref:non-ribosomal peptide synthetase n=1 Tax=Methylocapsa aurea TaxID=663610 RepID=UPI00068B6253|nr:non-ribosomal peptide synthetase [Methylocapsa aurea]
MTIALAHPPLALSELEARAGRPATLAQLLLRAAQWRPESGLRLISADIEGADVARSYPELLDEAQRISAGLSALGRRPGDRIVLLLEGAGDFIPAFWASILGGYIPCPLAPIHGDPGRWATQLSHIQSLLAGPLVVVSERLREGLPDIAGLEVAELDSLRASAAEERAHKAEPEDIAVLMLTSGSTGNSKAVGLTHANILASLAGKTERQNLTAADVTLNWISFDHVAALLEAHLLPLYVGATQLHADAATILADPTSFLRLIDRRRVTMTFTPNFLLGQIVAALESPRAKPLSLDLSSLRHIVSGGEAVVTETARRFLSLLAPYGLARTAIWPAFGMTETCAGSVYSREFPDADAGREFASLGLPITGLEIRIADDQDVPARAGEPGELQLRGPMIFRGYYNNEEATRAAFTSDGWFRSGDLGRLENGRLSLVGRSKDSIIVSGVNYFSHELETALEQLDGVERSFAAAFPTRPPGADTEQLAVAFAPAFPLSDEPELHRLIIAIRNTAIALWGFRPTLILPLPKDAFPKTSLGKIQRSVLRKRLEAGELAAHEAHAAEATSRQLGGFSPAETETEIVIAEIYAEMFNAAPESISATASFFDLGGTSLDILKLKRHLEQRLRVAGLPIVAILQNPSVRALAARIASGDGAEGAYDPIVPLQLAGDKTPLFCVHPGVGEVLVFVNLAKYFVNERPFYALRARGFNEGEAFFTRFDEMVGVYVEAIRRRQPNGPYAIAGYSYGGAVAFEIAKVLEAQGERVDFIGVFNLPPHIKYRMDELDPIEGAVNLAFFLSLIDKKQSEELPAKLRAESPQRDVSEYLVGVAPPARLIELDIDVAKFRAWAGLAQSLLTMGRSYVPSGAVESLVVFYAIPLRGTKEDWLNNELRRWDDFSRSPNRYVETAGEHYTLMGSNHVASFQALLRAELDRALGGK